MTEQTAQPSRAKPSEIRWAIVGLPMWAILLAFGVQRIIVGEPTWFTGVGVALNSALVIANLATLWKSASNV